MPMTEPNTVAADVQYEERLVCFVDLLGFKSAIDASKTDTRVLNALHQALSELSGERLVSLLHKGVPTLTGEGQLTTAEDAGATHIVQQHFPLVVTQFSDSLVLSCSADNKGSCLMLLQAIDRLQHIFFSHLGMLMRGGVSKGSLIHIQGGPLFGPAMNAAYALESQQAVYPRILFDQGAAVHMQNCWGEDPSPIFTTSEGHHALDLVSSLIYRFRHDQQNWDTFEKKLTIVAKDIEANGPVALPKVRYLQDRLKECLGIDKRNQR